MLINRVTQAMIQATNQKFEAWDKVLEEGYLDGTEEQIAYTMQLLEDPTIYMYAFFKDKDMNPLKLYPYQDIIINDPWKRILFAAANQIGKSFTLCCKATHYALTHPGTTTLMISKTLPQSKDLLRQIKRLLDSSTLEYKAQIGDSDNKTEIYFRHYNDEGEELTQSRIICVPATEAALGYPADLLLIDEIAFYEDGRYFYFQIAQPRTYTTKGQIICFSNPNGQMGVFWELFNDEDFHKYNFNFLDKPGNTIEEYESLRRKLTRQEFDSTVNAVFTDPEGGFISLAERNRMQEQRENYKPVVATRPLYIFFDFAKSKDRTVRIIGVPIAGKSDDWAPMVYIYEMFEYPLGTPYSDIVDELQELTKTYGSNMIAMVGWDNTGVGKGIEDFINRIQQVGIPAVPVEYSLENKSRMYTLFKLLIEQGRIKIPFVPECDKQLAQLRFKRTERNQLKVHHESEADRDDYPDALAGICSLIISPDSPPITCEVI